MNNKLTGFREQVSVICLLFVLFPVTCNLSTVLAHSEVQTVVMSEDGFEPSQVTVDENSTVLFLNKDKVDRWPASNIHPTHDLYPEFDPTKPIAPGQSWVFIPKNKGQWKYHDHLFPHFRGTLIVVKEKDGPVSEIKDDVGIENFFTKIKNLFLNFYGKFSTSFLRLSINSSSLKIKDIEDVKKVFDVKGSVETWSFFKQTFKGEAGSSGNVHDMAHLIGSLVFEKEGFEGIAICSADYAFGCYHGFLDKAFEKNLDNLENAEIACSSLGPINSGPVASCIHGIGHGVASFYNTSDLKNSLMACNSLKTGSNYCHDGVFMEFARGASSSFYPLSDRLSPCSNLREEFGDLYSFACGRNQPEVLMQRFNLSFEEVIDICSTSDDAQFKSACFDTLGFKLANTANSPDGIIAGCSKINDAEFMARCTEAAAGELIFQEVPGWQTKAPFVCNFLKSPFYESCHQHLQRLIQDYHRR
ncbi:hypothetical protein A3C59_00100 [Candidatus Daviesbacteria bacterium RIFCSPHIGHO2_02_FULL_36_13]|uniref:EfeO-type cupredoxin-like domain-containing protein n=1 Tax=Candidatus Daviesbacteria bacterium RIFCSPHIGHO2_02_FULL_36_13 TaxID=1797768 RepID=A0A1F5JYL5_9BACT|nr:MAG: hypothetical protein A3C59_00100 [Candidatus Daviesbacteria bacterium RIFCSPHIGHO2_02_FULL_36_13]OGE40873.1 MAG: hypothetical protein A3A45_01295 [Candidatus Daviesbacteria bacterium RIFCSPLOWO2_01_FULL_36_8]